MKKIKIIGAGEGVLALTSPNCLSADMLQAGRGEAKYDGWVHCKTVPYSIVAIPVVGTYILECSCRSAKVKTGEAWLTPPNLPLRITHVGDPSKGGRMKMKWLHFQFTLFDSADFMSLIEFPMRIGKKTASRLLKIIDELLELQSSSKDGVLSLVRRNELGFRALFLLCSVSKAKPDSLSSLFGCRKFRPVFDCMKENVGKRTGVGNLAKVANLSPSRFHAAFREKTGISPMKYMRRLRLSAAFNLVMTGNIPMKEIASQTGFCNEFHLSREFKKAYGKSPSLYRRAAEKSLQGGFY